MENVLSRATQLLQNGAPEQALLLLNEQNSSTSECEQLKSVCKRAFSEQYLWLLNDAAKNNRKDEIKAYVNRYHNLIGHDGSIAKYEAMLTTESAVSYLNNSTINSKNNVWELALMPIGILLLILLINIFSSKIYELCNGWGWERPWILAVCMGNFLYIGYLVIASIVFAKISNNRNKLCSAWAIISLFTILSEFVSGFDYDSFGFLMTLRSLNIIADLLLIVFLIMQLEKTTIYKVPLIVGAIAESITLVNILLGTYVAYKQHIEAYLYENLGSLYKTQNITYYISTILMAATFLLFFLISKKTNTK